MPGWMGVGLFFAGEAGEALGECFVLVGGDGGGEVDGFEFGGVVAEDAYFGLDAVFGEHHFEVELEVGDGVGV